MTAPTSTARPCPICARPAEAGYKPFCSKRCADVDLQRWLSDAYIIPGEPEEGDEASPPPHDDEG